MADKFEIIVTDGLSAGTRFPLGQQAEVLIGRSKSGLQLKDPLVSMKHARVHFEHGRYWLSDGVDSSGTYVKGKRLGEQSVPLDVGTEFQVGNTYLLLEQVDAIPLWIGPLVALLLCMVFGGLYVARRAAGPVSYDPVFATESGPIRAPLSWVRRTGLDARLVSFERQTDLDGDGRPELWLRGQTGVHLVRVKSPEEWEPLGFLPNGCESLGGAGFPDYQCAKVRYVFGPGGYSAVSQEGVVAWFSADNAFGTVGTRAAFTDGPRLASFLAARGVTEPIHYLICETAVPGVRAQVLTTSGHLKTLEPGCIRKLSAKGTRSGDFKRPFPDAVAFTRSGLDALRLHSRLFFSGESEGLFAGAQRSSMLRFSQALPTHVLGLSIKVQADPAPSSGVASGVLAPLPELLWAAKAVVQPELFQSITLDGPGVSQLALSGCSKLKINAPQWICASRKWCGPERAFLTIEEVGCHPGLLLSVPFSGGLSTAITGENEIAVSVMSVEQGGQIDVLKAEIFFRPRLGTTSE